MANVVNIIEDYLCDKCDELFTSDGIVCDKVFNPEEPENRAAFITQVLSAQSDQNGIGDYSAQILEHRIKRSECIADVEKIRKNFNICGDKLQNGLAIYISIVYITMPNKTVVGTQTIYWLSANLKITVK